MKFAAIALTAYLCTVHAKLLCEQSDFYDFDWGDSSRFTYSTNVSDCAITAPGTTMIGIVADICCIDDFDLSFDVTFDPSVIPQYSTWASVYFRRQNTNEYYSVSFQNYGSLLVEFGKRSNSGYTTLVNKQIGSTVMSNETFNVRVSIDGTSGYVHVDSVEQLSYGGFTEYAYGQLVFLGRYDTVFEDIDILATSAPTGVPTTEPTVQPSMVPSMDPTGPSMVPSMDPTVGPSMVPSMEPTVSTIHAELLCEQSDFTGADLPKFTFSTTVSDCTITAPGTTMIGITADIGSPYDFVLDFDVTFDPSVIPQYYTWASVEFRKQSSNEYYSVSFQNYDSLLVEFGKGSSSAYTTLVNKQIGLTVTSSKTFSVRVFITGTSGYVHVDSVEQLRYDDFTEYAAGPISFHGRYDTVFEDINILMEPTGTLPPSIGDIVIKSTFEDESAAYTNQQWVFAIICAVLFVFSQ